ncbi:glycosyltransferase [Falsirhodobacter halotolerans]|uniref:glycosyltransferase n=1 Tax=Falsirhodobacter halotolerans TaxID=1146892 RepID=UPI001FD09126|nr:glycosyltransferase [Falsirhodobacter halotolerans]MCJ8139062.1 glycosyltransferase [Falsirhodobacter halotolerans]
MRFAVLCPPYASHLHAFSALAAGLVTRGHEVTFVLPEGVEVAGDVKVLRCGPPPSHVGLRRHAISAGVRRMDHLCRMADRLRDMDVILGDQTEPATGLIADYLGLPQISVACALPLDPAPGVPLPFLGWPFDPSERGLRRNAGGERVARMILWRQNRMIASWADRFGLGPRRGMEECLSPLLTLSQTLPGFDFPRPEGPVVEVGPLRGPERSVVSDIRPDPSRPFVYASFGTLQGHRLHLLRRIAEGCRRAGVQLLVSHGGGLSDAQADRIGATWVRAFVPQETVLDQADLCITHGGLNTVMEALMRGVPLLAIPLAFDQFGVAARVVHHGAGLRLSRHRLGVEKVQAAVERLLRDPTFARNAARFPAGGGVKMSVDRIEAALMPRRTLVAAQ